MNLLELIDAVRPMTELEARRFLVDCGVHREVTKAILAIFPEKT